MDAHEGVVLDYRGGWEEKLRRHGVRVVPLADGVGLEEASLGSSAPWVLVGAIILGNVGAAVWTPGLQALERMLVMLLVNAAMVWLVMWGMRPLRKRPLRLCGGRVGFSPADFLLRPNEEIGFADVAAFRVWEKGQAAGPNQGAKQTWGELMLETRQGQHVRALGGVYPADALRGLARYLEEQVKEGRTL